MSFFEELRRRNVIRVGIAYLAVGWLLVQVADTVLPIFGYSESTLRVVISVIAIGILPALAFAWIYELTPQGLRKESELDAGEVIATRTTKVLDRVIMIFLALALGYFAFDKFVLDPQRDADRLEKATEAAVEQAFAEAEAALPERSIVVLPFADLSQEGDQEYFGDGIAEELLNLLTRIPELRVISRSSAFSFKGKGLDIPAIASQLKVAHVLTGSVRMYGGQVRITAQLIDANTDANLWSGSYDRAMDNIFAIQDQIALLVVRELKITLLDEMPAVEETYPEAYSLYLQAKHLSRQITAEGYEQSIELLQRVLVLDPDYAPAWDGLASIYITQASKGLRPMGEGFELARDAAQRALAINRKHAQAHTYLGWIAMFHDNDLQAAARHYKRALELEINARLIGQAAGLSHTLGRLNETIALREYVVAHDPVDAIGYYNLGFTYLDAGLADKAIGAFETALRLSPGTIGAHYGIGVAHLLKNDPQAALEAFRREEGDEEYRVKGTALAHYELGQLEEFERYFTELKDEWGEEWPSEIAHVYAWTGDADSTFAWLDKAVAEEGGLNEQFLLPFFVPVHDDPRWAAFLEQTGTAREQLDAVEFKVTLPEIIMGSE